MSQEPLSRAAKLRTISLFKGLSDEQLLTLAPGMLERRYQAGELVVKEGDPGLEMFIVLEGDFQIFVSALGIEREVARVGPGGYFGEIAILTGRKRLASIRALSAGHLLVLHREQILDLLERSPAAAMALCHGMADYVEQTRRNAPAIGFVHLSDFPAARDLRTLIPPRVSAFCQAVAVERDGDRVKVALVDPRDETRRAFLRDVLRQYRVEFVAVGEDDYERFRNLYLERPPTLTGDGEVELQYLDADNRTVPLGDRETGAFLQGVIGQAVRGGASDLHFEMAPAGGRVRLRIDGNMFPIRDGVPSKLYAHVVSRVKVMADLDITIRRLPQDGHFPLLVGDRRVEVRVSVTPCQGGEKVVMRLLDPEKQKAELNGLILSRPVAMLARDMFVAPSGLLLVCGPTGSGKTTTLYAGLHEMWEESQSINVVTAEDPVEYQLPFATQISVDHGVGLDYPKILRTILRQDPDVLLIGEIRDEESAAIALEAAVTGHLVLSSLHTDSALESITRLRNLRVKPYLLSAALRGVIAQRLVPRVCRSCAKPIVGDDEHVAYLRAEGILAHDWDGPAHRGHGCEVCSDRGEIGRTGVFEVLTVDPKLRTQIEGNAPLSEMQKGLTSDVFIPLSRYGRFLVEEGVASPERIRELFPAKRFQHNVDW